MKQCLREPQRRLPRARLLLLAALAAPLSTWAARSDECMARGLRGAGADTTVEAIRQRCDKDPGRLAPSSEAMVMECLRERAGSAGGATLAREVLAECRQRVESGQDLPASWRESRRTEANPYVLSPLRQNYLLPYSRNEAPNQAVYQGTPGFGGPLDSVEAKLQLSLKVPLAYSDLLMANDGLYFGFTLKSFWQVYNRDLSSPFRETNYRPEVFYQAPLPIRSAPGRWFGRIGLEHESNGRTQLSRSWDRAYAALGYVEEDWGLMVQPWYRLPEEAKVDDGNPATPLPPQGDDNPDIEDYFGNFELTGAYRWRRVEVSGLFRRNFEEGHGALEIGASFPLWGRLRGFAQYFEGYGESLVDYNHRSRRLGVGVLLTDLL